MTCSPPLTPPELGLSNFCGTGPTPTAMSDAELEAHIRDCGELMRLAYEDHDHQAAERWQEAMYRAIAQRSPAQQARMEAEIQARIDDGPGYFMARGVSA